MTTTKLPDFKGRPVDSATVKIRNTGDGLSKAMRVDPQQHAGGEKVFVVLECSVAAFDYVHDRERDSYGYVEVLRAGRATFVSADLVTDVLNAQQERIDAAAGVSGLPFADADDAALDAPATAAPEGGTVTALSDRPKKAPAKRPSRAKKGAE